MAEARTLEHQTRDGRFGEFTEAGYKDILRLAKERYRFERFGTATEHDHVLWRHDLDYSIHRALRLARIEADLGVHATYFFFLRTPYYSLMETATVIAAREILSLGHNAGLHFDPTFYTALGDSRPLESAIEFERGVLEDVLGTPVEVLSFHNPAHAGLLDNDAPQFAGMLSAYGKGLREEYEYISDSFGYWRFRPLREVLETGVHKKLHVLTHPEWWVPEAMPPRERVSRCVNGRAAAMMKAYDDLMEEAGMTETLRALRP